MAKQDIMSRSSHASSTIHRSKNRTPEPLPTSSMTPPPSSQSAVPQQPVTARTPTPTHSHLSSPPPTVKGPISRAPSDTADPSMFSPEQVGAATAEDLRQMVDEAMAACREARASAAHQNLQYNLLWMESSEAMKRMQVELEMAHKEVEVLQAKSQDSQRPGLATPIMSTQTSPSDHLLASMRNQCYALEVENDVLRRRLTDLNTLMLERETALEEENERLRERIRVNRKHTNMLRRSAAYEQEASTVHNTPYNTSSNRQPRTQLYATPQARDDPPFAALLAAVNSEEATKTPSTPSGHRGHTRAAYSMSSIPSTPHQARTAPQPSRKSAAYFASRESPLAPRSAQQLASKHRRRESRDSTISASDAEEVEAYESEPFDEVPESQASQEAANMLRRSAQSSFGASAAAATKSSGLLQTKLYGPVVKKASAGKGGNGKRGRLASSEVDQVSKKGRMHEGVGLGIGGWAS